MKHLMNDDLDEVSKLEVIYKILKDQLREYQKQLIKVKKDNKRQSKSPMKEGFK